MLAISGFTGVMVGVSFGIPLGLLLSMEQRAKLVWIGCGAIVVMALWSMFVFSREDAPGLSIGYFISSALEVAIFMAALLMVGYATHRFAAGLSARSKNALGIAALVCALLVYYELLRMLQVV
jgi:hypothetical protein